MIDEMHELQRADRIDPDAVRSAVAIDRDELLDLLEADGQGRRRLRIVGGRSTRAVGADGSARSSNRIGYVAATAAAAAVVVALVTFGADEPGSELDVLGPAGEAPPASSAVDETLGPPDDDSGSEAVVVTVDGPEAETETGAETEAGADEPVARATTSTTRPSTTSTVGSVGVPATSETSNDDPSDEPTSGGFNQTTDLLSLHFDHAHFDDGLAAVAAVEVTDRLGIEPHVVSGTRSLASTAQVHRLEPVMQAAWGDRWIDARGDRTAAVDRTATRWLETLDRGGRVWVAEGGVSDFTAEVIREIRARRPELATEDRVHVIQHALSNEAGTTDDELAFVEANTSYEKIDDGNIANDTADLNQAVDGFEATALGGRHGDAWAIAFGYLPAARLDFSDTVLLLHILGVGPDEVAGPGDFADRFMG